MRIKICGLFRDNDIDYVNEARPDYAGFVFAKSRRQVSPEQAARLRRRLAAGIVPVGVFVNSPPREIAALYHDGVIAIAQLHGEEDDAYIVRLKNETAAGGRESIPVIQVFICEKPVSGKQISPNADYYLVDSGAGSGKTFDWNMIKLLGEIDGGVAGVSPAEGGSGKAAGSEAKGEASPSLLRKPWFLAGGINLDNIERAIALNPFAVDISSGAETDGVKDREKIIQLVGKVRMVL